MTSSQAHHENGRCRIALTGGPGGGKTTAADLFRREIGDRVVIVPESATLLFSGGFPRVDQPHAVRAAQRAIYHVQRNLEDAQSALYPERILLCDRGTVDGGAYWPGEPRDFFGALGTTLEAELDRYDAVIFFESAAVGGMGIEGGNPTRIEDNHAAVRLDRKLLSLWSRHRRFVLVPHNPSFFKKITFGLASLESIVAQLGASSREAEVAELAATGATRGVTFNPYEAPRAPEPIGAQAPLIPGAPQPWDAGEVLGVGWEAVKRHWPVLVFAPLVSGMIASVPSYIPTVITATGALDVGSSTYWAVYAACTGAGLVMNVFFQVGQIRIFVAAARGQPPDFAQIFAGAGRFLPLLGTVLLAMLAFLAGFALLIVPGVILSLGLSLAQFYCVDAEMGVLESLQASWEATKGHRGAIFVLGLISLAVMLLGFVACCVGIYVALPVVMVAMATVYLRLSGRTGGPPPWPGGFGSPGANWPPQAQGNWPPQAQGNWPPQAQGNWPPQAQGNWPPQAQGNWPAQGAPPAGPPAGPGGWPSGSGSSS